MKKIRLVIPAHNRLAITQQGLKSLDKSFKYYNTKDNNILDLKVIIVDDGSTDGTGTWIRENYPEYIVLEGNGNLWWTGSVSVGAKYALEILEADFVLLWNDDITPALDYFSVLEDIVNKDILKGAVIGSKIVFSTNKDKVWSVGGEFNKNTGSYRNLSMTQSDQKSYFESDWLPGMGTLIPKSIFDAGIWWDVERFPQYHGDSDFCLQCKEKGIKILTILNLIIYNDTETSGIVEKRTFGNLRMGLTSIRSSMNFKKNMMFYTKHGNLPFAYAGMTKKYFYYIGSFVKYTIKSIFK